MERGAGCGHGGAAVEGVRLMKAAVEDDLGVRAAGGIRTLGDAMAMWKAGASRIGTSAGIEILEDIPA